MRFLIVAAMAACIGGVAMAAEVGKSVTDKAVIQLETKDWESARCWICDPTNWGGTKPR
ncbi:MAG: hypothetical protein K2X34_10495 [Hyphomonadaceae bacterium]|nr:hypothetical protein [Hyphomonadaceae bacterium]